MKGQQAVEAALRAAAGEEEDEEKESGDWFHGIGMLDTGYKMWDKDIIGNR